MPSQIELYEAMKLLSSRMVAAAHAGDWEQLIELERGVGRLRETLLATSDDGHSATIDLARKHNLIRRILEDDAEVRRHTEPWMERIRHFLGDELSRAVAVGAGETARG